MSEENNTPKPRVTSIEVGKTYNCGNYENIRISLRADVPEEASAALVLKNLQGIIEALAPDLIDEYKLDHARELIAKNEAPVDEWDKRRLKESKELIAKWKLNNEKREQARAALDNLGGTYEFIDHKEKWEDPE